MAALEKSSYDEIDDVDEIPLSILDPPPPARAQMPPLPDLRFEHSYMKSIANAETWYQVAWITFQTQVSFINELGLSNYGLCADCCT